MSSMTRSERLSLLLEDAQLLVDRLEAEREELEQQIVEAKSRVAELWRRIEQLEAAETSGEEGLRR